MARSLIPIIVLILTSSYSAADAAWRLELYGDEHMSSCSVSYSAPGVIQVHIFQTGDAGAGASEFSLYPPECMTGATWLGDIINPEFLTIWDTQNYGGIAVAFGGCVQMPIHIGYVNFMVTDINVACCEFAVTDPHHPDIGINTVDCAFTTIIPMTTKSVVLNPTPSCPCEQPLAVESTTWGQVKALYR